MTDNVPARVLVTGADGFIGSVLCRQLQARGCHLVTLTRRARPALAAVEPGLETPGLSGDIRDQGLLTRAVTGVDTIFHLAGIAHVDGRDRAALQAVNVDATLALADTAAKAGVSRFVYFSSSLATAAEVARKQKWDTHKGLQKEQKEDTHENSRSAPYQADQGQKWDTHKKQKWDTHKGLQKEQKEDTHENSRPAPYRADQRGYPLPAKNISEYGQSKHQAEMALMEVGARSQLEVSILRPVNVYGPGMKGNLASLIRLIERRRLPPLPDLDTHISLIGVEDLCEAAWLAATDSRAAGQTCLVTDGVDYRLNEIESAIYIAAGRQPPGWRPPRALWWLGACAAEMAGRMRPGNASLGLRTWHNLTTSMRYPSDPLLEELGFEPGQTFYTALPGLLGIK